MYTNYVLRRLLIGLFLLFGITVVIFVLVRIIPGDPALGIMTQRVGEGRAIDPVRLEALREELGLNRPLVVQYGDWIWDTLHGDLGKAISWDRPVSKEIPRRFARTAQVALLGLTFILVTSTLFGTLAAVRQGSLLDNAIRLVAVGGMALPTFLIGTLVIFTLVIYFHWFPPITGYVTLWSNPWMALKQFIWPALALAFYFGAVLTRLVRNTMLEVLREDYVRTARAKGLSERLVTFRHALRNTLAPNLTMFSLLAIELLGGSVIIENIFNINGLGAGLIEAVSYRDYAYIQAAVLVFGVVVVGINLVTDLLYGFVDPRIRLE
ncbi:MAG: ABC transporter permease [Dehalococcoidia bacterium]